MDCYHLNRIRKWHLDAEEVEGTRGAWIDAGAGAAHRNAALGTSVPGSNASSVALA